MKRRVGALAIAAVAIALVAACSSDPSNADGDATASGGDGGDTGKANGKCGFDPNSGNLDRAAKLAVYAGSKLINTGDTIQADTGGLKLGDPLNLSYAIKNAAAKDVALELIVDKVLLKYSGPNGSDDGAFVCVYNDADGKERPCAGASFPSVIPPGFDPACATRAATETLGYKIRFTKLDNVPRECTVTVFAQSAGNTLQVQYKIATKAGKPAISVQPPEVNFGVVGTGQTKTETLSVLNTGDANLQVKGLTWTATDPQFSLDIAGKHVESGKAVAFDPPLEVTPGSALPVLANFMAGDDKGHVASIEFQHNANNGTAQATLKGNYEVPCILVTPQKKLDMGLAYIGSTITKQVLLQNCGAVDVVVSKAELSDDAQGVYAMTTKAPTAVEPITIPKNGKSQVAITCTPPSENKDEKGTSQPFTAKLNLQDNTTAPNKVVEIACMGTAAACPTPVIDTAEQIEPQTPLKLDASKSFAKPGQSVKKYKWSVTKMPAGATSAQFYPSDTSPTPTFGVQDKDPKTGKDIVWVTVAGEYCFSLDIEDSSGTKGCEAATACVAVIPSVALHVELLWDTPADTNKGDTGENAGTDLDLHFVHPKAYDGKLCTGTGTGACQPDLDKDGLTDPWFNGVYDAYWYNTWPSWGNPADGQDNPSLDRDDVDGWGPENLNVVAPEDNTLYGVGVHYWSNNGFFPDTTTATVNLYISGTLKGSYVQQMVECDLWWVMQIKWASGDLVPFAGANLPAPSTGKITPGYWSNLGSTLNGKCKKK
ncbi:MAG: choice-of-anchor D domain-containing protein [Deltaproteobacteria bacterium]|nr:choice-of-anchor D domain-containing protein [Deltaproteobacteria bacterium]